MPGCGSGRRGQFPSRARFRTSTTDCRSFDRRPNPTRRLLRLLILGREILAPVTDHSPRPSLGVATWRCLLQYVVDRLAAYYHYKQRPLRSSGFYLFRTQLPSTS